MRQFKKSLHRDCHLPRRSGLSRPRQLVIESLERRNLLAADVQGLFLGERIPVGDEPVDMAVAIGDLHQDLNEDGLVDFVTANYGDLTVSVRLGNGDGTFTDAGRYVGSDTFLNAVSIGEVDGDGNQDIVTTGNRIYSVLLGNGDGTFQEKATYDVDDSTFTTSTLRDVNHDNRLDLIAGHWASDQVSVMLGTGNGTFQDPMFYSVLDRPYALSLEDVNLDTHPDIVAANTWDDSVSVLLNNGDGTFQSQVRYDVGGSPESVSFGLLNNDIYPDIVTSNSWDRSITVLFNDGDGTFSGRTDYQVGDGVDLIGSASVGDLNGGRADVMVVGDGNSWVFSNNGDGTFAGLTPQAVSGGRSFNDEVVRLVDVNQDGLLDALVTNRAYDDVSLLIGNGDGTFQDFHAVDEYPIDIALGDLTNDGKLDVVTANRDSDTVSVLRGYGDGTFTPQTAFDVGQSPMALDLGKVNVADGNQDVATANYSRSPYPDSNVSVLLGHGDGTFFPQMTYDMAADPLNRAPHAIELEDVAGSDALDLVCLTYDSYNTGDREISVRLGNGSGTFQDPIATDIDGSPTSLAIGRLNGDQMPDIVVGHTSHIEVFLGNGDGTFTSHAQYGDGNFSEVALGDIDGNRHLDVIAAESSDDKVMILLGLGDGGFLGPFYVDVGYPSHAIALGDVTGDGHLDIVTANSNDNCVSVVPGFGNGSFGDWGSYGVGFAPNAILLGNLDADNSLDIIVANSQEDTVSVLINQLDTGAPALAPIGDKSINEEATLSFTVTAGDVIGLTLSAAGLPSGATFNPETGLFSWTPTELQGGGVYPVTFTVTDNSVPNLTDSETISITVAEVNKAPVLKAIGNKSVDKRTELTFTPTASDRDVPSNTLTFSLDAGAPTGAQIDPASGVFTWTPTESQGPNSYQITVRVTDDGKPALNDFETITVTVGEVGQVTDLGTVDFLVLDELSLAGGSLLFSVTTAHPGFLTLETIQAGGWESARIHIYNVNPQENPGSIPLGGESQLVGGNARNDWLAEQGQQYFVELYGDNPHVDLRITNLVRYEGPVVSIAGTAGDDKFEFTPTGSYSVKINGVEYHIDDGKVTTAEFTGGDGFDEASLYDSAGNETLEAWPDRAVMTNGSGDSKPDFTVKVAGIDSLLAYATRDGVDTAMLHGSAGNDKLKSYADSARLRAKNNSYALRTKRFDSVLVDSGIGNDLAVFNGTGDDETFTYAGVGNKARIEAAGRDHSASGFGTVVVHAGGGDNDVAYFTDTLADDVLYFKSHKTVLVSPQVKVTVRAVDKVHATVSESGAGVARLYDTLGDDHLEVAADTARVYRHNATELDLLYEAIGFECVKAYSTEGNDTTDIKEHAFELLLYGWD